MATETPKLRIAIIGSGLAGLAAARVLRSHHTVTVYERGTASTATGGQGTIATPNAVKILEPLGFDRARVRSVRCSGYRTFDKAGNVIGDRPLDLKQRYGADWYMHLRADYRDELLRLATAPKEELAGAEDAGEPATVVFETAVVDIDPDAGTFELSDGSSGEADFIIGMFFSLLPLFQPQDQVSTNTLLTVSSHLNHKSPTASTATCVTASSATGRTGPN